MAGSVRTTSLDDLLAQAGWLRRLARQLVKDGRGSDDLTQETWVATLRRPPDGRRPLRPWLAEVMRNLVRMRTRGERRRQARELEAAAAAEEPRSTSEELLARLEGQRLVVELVMALEEPYRSTVLLWFYEERSTREIARLEGVRPVTVRWRLKQALERLRANLAARGGAGRSGWMAVAAPLAQTYPGRPLVQGGLVMAAKTKVSVAIAALLTLLGLLGGGWLVARRISPGSGPATVLGEVAAGAPAQRGGFLPGEAPSGVAMAGSLDVRVVDPEGAPAAGVFVSLSRALGGTLPSLAASGRTDARGRLGFAEVPSGVYAVTASSPDPGLAPAVEVGVRIAARSDRSVRLELSRGGYVVRGTVVDSGAGPIPRARVTATQAAPPDDTTGALRYYWVSTDETGSYAMTLRGGVYSLVAQAEGYPRASQFLALEADATVSFRLDPGTSLAGRVRMRKTGAPVPGARVRAVPLDRAGYRRPGVESDAAGQFRLNDVAPGAWRLEARRGSLAGSTDVLRVIPTLDMRDLEITVDKAFTISGSVVGPDGAGLGRVVVVAELRGATLGSGARTEPDGSFRIEGLAPGHYELGAQTQEDRPRAYGEVAVVDRDVARVRLTMPAPVQVEGRVLDSKGEPAPNVRVYARMGQGLAASSEDHPSSTATPGARDVSRGSLATSEATGRFVFRGLDAGGLTLRAEHPQLGVAAWGPEVVRAGEVKSVTLRLNAGGTLVGTLMYRDGLPAAGATVSVRSPEQRGLVAHATAGPDGRFAVRGILPGWARVAAHRSPTPRFEESSTRIELAQGQSSTLALTIPRAARVRGTVLLADGRPAVAALVLASTRDTKPLPTHHLRATADPDGRFTLDDLDAGSVYHLWAEMPGQGAEVSGIPAGAEGVILKLQAR